MMKIPFVNFGFQYRQHKDEYDEAIYNCLNEGQLILQEQLEAFETNLAKRMNMKYAVGVANGTDALTLALKAKEIKNQNIATSGYTFKATAEAIKHSGNNPIFYDIDDNRQMLDSNVFPTLPVHIEGSIAYYMKNPIIEDAAQAIGAKNIGYSGTYTLSFYPAKILGCFGDGGAVLTNDKKIADKVRLLRHHWQTNENEEYAYNSRLDNVQAAFLDVKLKYLDEILARRKEIAQMYLVGLSGLPIHLPYNQEGRVWQDFVLTIENPIELADYLKEKGIETLGYGMTPPHKALNTGLTLPNVEKLYKEMIRLPLNETLTDKEVEYIIDAIKQYASDL